MSFFKAENIHKAYAQHIALDDVSIEVEKGSVFGLLGPNGAGKTSLIRIINQITAPDKGQVFFDNKPLHPNDITRIGYLPEERGLYKKMKVGEQAIYLAQLKGLTKQQAIEKLKYWFEKFEITAWWDKKVEELSKGMQQKIQFIVTILHEPELLIFDEPFSGFDPINANLLKREILALKENGATIIFSTHNMASVEEICDHIALINQSKKILGGSIKEVKERYKTNQFEFRFKGDINADTLALQSQFNILDNQKDKDETYLKLQLTDDLFSSNDLIKNALSFGDLISFNEVIPSMNDIFINVVESNK